MSSPKDKEGALLKRVRELLSDTPMTWLDIYKATGIAPNQLHNIKSGKTKAPSVNSIETLYTVLSGKPLEL